MTTQTEFPQHYARDVAIALGAAVLLLWTVFPFAWILLTSIKNPGDIISVPPKFVFTPTIDNYAALSLASTGDNIRQRARTFRCSS